jgi:hypothetical protein
MELALIPELQSIQWLLVAMMIAIGFIGGYYQLQITSNLKEGRRASVWTGG